jgi:2-keto-3-deoxy-L-rhamnonate aldolase RhmA
VGILTGDIAFAKHVIAMGAIFVGIGIDAAALARSTENLLAQFRS